MTGPEESANDAMKQRTPMTEISPHVFESGKRRPTPDKVTQVPIAKLPSIIILLLPNLFNNMKTPKIVKNKLVAPIRNEIISADMSIDLTFSKIAFE